MRMPLVSAGAHALVVVVLAGGLLAGCGKDSPTRPVATGRYSWIGSFSGGGQSGNVIIDVTQGGTALAGEIAMSSLGIPYARVVGTIVGDSVSLHLDPAYFSVPNDLLVRGAIVGGGLTATFRYAPNALDAALDCRALPRRTLSADDRRDLSLSVIAIAFDGTQLWLSTTGQDYVLMNADGTITGSVVVIHSPNAHWTSSQLMYDGAHMWGVYPITIIGPPGRENVADLLGFDANGRTPDSLRLDHRPAGLAAAFTQPWSLRGSPPELAAFDATGAVTATLPLAIPDAYGLAFEPTGPPPLPGAGRFWTVGWYLRRLYEVDLNGEVLSMCDLPRALTGSFAVGLTVEGHHVWYAEGLPGLTTLHRLTFP
jgi:hypothetical protein